jgi:ABC-2 type transport system ATP-binding protein
MSSPRSDAGTRGHGDAATGKGSSAHASDAVNDVSSVAASPRRRVPASILFNRVSKWYGPVIGLNQVSLELGAGITGLVGVNGSGKTTLMRLAAGLVAPHLGQVRICGQDPTSPATRSQIGYCPDVDSFYEEMSGRAFVRSMARLQGFADSEAEERTEEVLRRLSMTDQAHRRLAGYSKGMRQRIKLAQALVHDPQVLLLDEPLSGIDPVGRVEMIDIFCQLARQGKTLLISSHELEELEKMTDHVAIMARGRLAAVGPVARIRDLLDEHPLAVRVGTDQPRELAGALLRLDDVVGIDVAGGTSLVIRARNPQRFFTELTRLVIEEHIQVEHLETLDDSTHAVLGYLLGSSPGR